MCLDIWSQLVEMVGKVVRPLGGGASIQEVGLWGEALRFYSPDRLLLTLSLLSAPAPATMPSAHGGLHPQTVSQNQLFVP